MGIFFNSRGTFFRNLLEFTQREKRGVLLLLPLLATITTVIISAQYAEKRRGFDDISHLQSDSTLAENDVNRRNYNNNSHGNNYSKNRRNYSGNNHDYSPRTLPEPHTFDPNTLTAKGFEELGFSPKQAAVLVNYRAARGGFRTADDFARSFVVSDAMMARLRPYIVINQQDIGAKESRDEIPASPAGRIPSPLLELNAADSTALRTIRGIGNVLVVRVLNYRARLGGFARKEQLLEIPGITPENFARISEQILVDSALIQKINANFAPANVLGKHPYVTATMLRKLLRNRQLKGGFGSTQELVEQNIATPDQAARLDPYLVFEQQ